MVFPLEFDPAVSGSKSSFSLVPRPVEDADGLLELVLRHSSVDGRRLNIGVTQMLLNETQIAPSPPMQLYATSVTERMRVELRETGPTAEGLNELPDPLAGHAPLLCDAPSHAIPHHKHRFSTSSTGPLLREIVSENCPRHLGEGTAASSPPLP